MKLDPGSVTTNRRAQVRIDTTVHIELFPQPIRLGTQTYKYCTSYPVQAYAGTAGTAVEIVFGTLYTWCCIVIARHAAGDRCVQ